MAGSILEGLDLMACHFSFFGGVPRVFWEGGGKPTSSFFLGGGMGLLLKKGPRKSLENGFSGARFLQGSAGEGPHSWVLSPKVIQVEANEPLAQSSFG